MKIKEFKEKYKEEKDINHVMDYLNLYYIDKNINFNYEQSLIKANKWTEEINKKNKDLKDSGSVDVILEFEDGIKLVLTITKIIDIINYDYFKTFCIRNRDKSF